jgi:deoxyribodipyrimidine photo-lyase
MTDAPTIVWFRDDLRLADNPALHDAITRGNPVIPVFILDEESPEVRPLGAATKWWLHHSLTHLNARLTALGTPLVFRRGAADTVIMDIARETGAGKVVWNRRYGKPRFLDQRLKHSLTEDGIGAESFSANVLYEPWTITNKQGNPFQVFTPFWKACLASGEPREVVGTPTAIPGGRTVTSDALEEWHLLPTRPDWSEGLQESWTPGETGAHDRLQHFLTHGLEMYHLRDEPATPATSRLSPHLRFGEVSPVQVWHAVMATNGNPKNRDKFLSEVGWREFSISILFHRPDVYENNLKADFNHFPWTTPDEDTLRRWQRGNTGVPLVDAGMRELWHTGYMHNRVRMVAASFLIKNLLVDWRIGEAWFWDTLVDADEANNPASWQWVAGSGADAAPYFRVFNPVTQAERFDENGTYLDQWVPERSTSEYPAPMVDLGESRNQALAAYDTMKALRPTAPPPGQTTPDHGEQQPQPNFLY